MHPTSKTARKTKAAGRLVRLAASRCVAFILARDDYLSSGTSYVGAGPVASCSTVNMPFASTPSVI